MRAAPAGSLSMSLRNRQMGEFENIAAIDGFDELHHGVKSIAQVAQALQQRAIGIEPASHEKILVGAMVKSRGPGHGRR